MPLFMLFLSKIEFPQLFSKKKLLLRLGIQLNQEKRRKLDDRGEECRFLGFANGVKGFRLLRSNGSVFVGGSVKFDEEFLNVNEEASENENNFSFRLDSEENQRENEEDSISNQSVYFTQNIQQLKSHVQPTHTPLVNREPLVPLPELVPNDATITPTPAEKRSKKTNKGVPPARLGEWAMNADNDEETCLL